MKTRLLAKVADGRWASHQLAHRPVLMVRMASASLVRLFPAGAAGWLAYFALVGCGGVETAPPVASPATPVEVSAGGEQPANAGPAPVEEARSTQAPVEAPRQAKPIQPAPAPAPAPVASAWGSPLAEMGTPLPARAPLGGQARQSHDQGVVASRGGDDTGAMRAFEQAARSGKAGFRAYYNLGVLADRAGQEGKALDAYRRALSIQPDYEAAAAGIISIYKRNGQGERALRLIEPLARRWERNLYLHALHADVLASLGRYDDARDAARRALKRDERFVPAMSSLVKINRLDGKLELAESILDQALVIEADNPDLVFVKGQMLLEQERLAEALAKFRSAVELQPDHAEARMALGIRLLAGANYAEALVQFEQVVRLASKHVEAHLNLGDAYRATQQWVKAKESFDRALRMRSELPEAHFNLALMYLSAGAEFPGMDLLTALARAREEFGNYRRMKGTGLQREDPSTGYLEDIDKSIRREEKRIKREQARAERERQRAARRAAQAEGEGAESQEAEE